MLIRILSLFGSSFLLFLTACNISSQDPVSTVAPHQGQVEIQPEWVFSPSPTGGGFGGVGISARHIKGPSAQRQLAISRALDEIARQMGVSVTNVVETQDYVSPSGSESRMSSYSVQLSDGNKVTASLREIWEKPSTRELYVWMTTE